MKNSLAWIATIGGGLLLITAVIFAMLSYHSTDTATGCVIADKDRVWVNNQDGSGGKSQMRVYTENCGTFEVSDNIFKTDFNSADRFSKIKVGKTYDIEHYGWRFGLFSMFPKIERVS